MSGNATMLAYHSLNVADNAAARREMASSAWLLNGLEEESGCLIARDHRLLFVDDASNVRIDTTQEQAELTFPWYYWGDCRLRLCGERFRITFAPPGGCSGRIAFRLQGWEGGAVDLLLTAGPSADGRLLAAAWRHVLGR